ncbi:MAG: putative disulfide oxidoreductase, partial [Firmicutes bacterium]|nr:putative disulfide oxidoreductase [Bacillota bacterium]
MADLVVDVVVIGGGPAGMSAALVLGRARRSVIVVDAEQPRNRVVHESHGFLTRDGVSPTELRAIARAQIAAYPSVRFERDTVTELTGENGAFTAQTRQGRTIRSRKVLFATGKQDVLPAIDGLAAVYGRSAFVCPYCDGWELRDWPQARQLARNNVALYEGAIARIDHVDAQVSAVRLDDGTQVSCTGLFVALADVQSTGLPEQLGCRMTPAGSVHVADPGETS